MICTETVRHQVATWSCGKCYRVFHLYCVKKWAKSEGSGTGNSFRCPSCQHEHSDCPSKYNCFCGKAVDPQPDGFITPHSCGDACGRRRGHGCTHRCTLQCHPGPCPDCTHMSEPVSCPCGKHSYMHPCGKPDPKKTCGGVCGKPLACGSHVCMKPCHWGPCDSCEETADVKCRCGKASKKLPCGSGEYSCDAPCGKTQRCGVHSCTTTCHGGTCPPCDADPEIVFSCPCGKKDLPPASRKACTDAIPTCGSVCGKVLLCGNHYCTEKCHTGPCAVCDSKVSLTCPCGSTQQKLYCRNAKDFRCDKKCKAKMSCGKHECSTICCPHRRDPEPALHTCTRPCGKQLPCGHHCADPCHRGQCPPCINLVTDELRCACGAQVVMPPQPCGTKPPACDNPCLHQPPCGHPAIPHDCHFGPCPPCTHKVERTCLGGHTTVRAVMCSASGVSCGQPCAKPIAVCGHPCPRKCHDGDCADKKRCVQKCGQALDCGHPCQQKCHAGRPCGTCSSTVDVPCACGIRTQPVVCPRFIEMKAACEDGQQPTVPCSNECTHEQRLAALSSIGGGARPVGGAASKTYYSIRLWQSAQKSIDHIIQTEKHLANFVRSQEKQTCLPPMQRERRALVHELAVYYQVKSEAVDREPNRTCQLSRTPLTHLPSQFLGDCVYDAANSPVSLVQNILSSSDMASKLVIVFEGPPEHMTEHTVLSVLKVQVGKFVVVAPENMSLAFPNGKVPTPAQACRNGETIAYLAVFAKGTEAANAFAQTRKNGCPVTFHWFREAPPPMNFTDPNAVQARYFIDVATTTVHAAPSAGPGGASGKPRPGSGSWANMVRKETSRQKDQRKPVEVDTGNKFAALRR